MIRRRSNEKSFEHRHINDVIRIREVFADNGYEADLDDCARLWDNYSDSYAAGWLGLPESDEDLWSVLKYEYENGRY